MDGEQAVMKRINEIINEGLAVLKTSVKDKVESGSFVNIYPESDQEREQLVDSINPISKMISATNTGEIYVLDEPVKTKLGQFELIKIRVADPAYSTKGAIDFIPKDYAAFKGKYSTTPGFDVVNKDTFEIVELRAQNSRVVLHFPNRTLAEALGIHYGVKRGI